MAISTAQIPKIGTTIKVPNLPKNTKIGQRFVDSSGGVSVVLGKSGSFYLTTQIEAPPKNNNSTNKTNNTSKSNNTTKTLDASIATKAKIDKNNVIQLQGGSLLITPIESNVDLSEAKDVSRFYGSTKNLNTTGSSSVDPPSLLMQVNDVEVTPFQKKYEYIETPEGLQGVEKQCDQYLELSLKTVISHMNASTYQSTIEPSAPIEGAEFKELRQNLLADYEGRTCYFTCDMFKVFVGLIDTFSYTIPSGMTDAEYSIEIKEVV